MSLISISLLNFKSYKGSFEFSFDKTPFVCVVGPNGSGKSNLLDAICFVVGLPVEKLRCRDLKELINQKKDKEMFVTLTLGETGGQTTQFKRTPESYFVNDVEVSHDEYINRWSQSHILPSGKNSIVLQGDIEQLAGAESQELANLIESMNSGVFSTADIVKYHEIQQELENAVDSTRKLTRSGRAALAEADHSMKLGEARSKLEDLNLQLRKCERRKEVMIEREKNSVLNGIRQDIRTAKQQLDNALEEQQLAESDSKKLRSEFAKKRRILQNARNTENEAKEAVLHSEAALEPLVKRSESLETELRLLTPEIEFNQKSVEESQGEISAANESIELLQREFDRDKARESKSATKDLSPELKELWLKLDGEFIKENVVFQDELRTLRRDAEKALQQLNADERKSEDYVTEMSNLSNREANNLQRVRHFEKLIEERSLQQEQRREELNRVAEELVATESEQKEYSEKLKDLSSKIKQADVSKQALVQRHRLLDAVDRLKRGHNGVYDILGNLVEANEPKFRNALERAITSKNMDTIVVDTMETAISCIEQAKTDRLGILNFIALSNLKQRDLASSRALVSRHTSRDSDVRLLVDCAKFDPVFRPALLAFIGDTCYVPSFEEGMKLRNNGLSMRLVTSNGSVISTTNIVSTTSAASLGGITSHRHLALMQRNVTNLTEKLKIADNKELDLTDKEVRLNGELGRAVTAINSAKEELVIAKEQLRSVQNSIENLNANIESHNTRLDSSRELYESAQGILDRNHKKLTSMRSAKFKEFLLKTGGDITEWDDKFSIGAQKVHELGRQGQRLNDRLQLATQKYSSASSQLKKHRDRMSLLDGALAEVIKDKERVERELSHNVQKLNQARTRLSTARSEAEAKSDEVGMIEGTLDTARVRVQDAQRETNKHKVALSTQLGRNPNEQEDGDNADESDYDDVILNDDEDSDIDLDDEVIEEPATNKRKRSQTVKLDRQALSIDRLESRIAKLKSEIEVLAGLVGVAGDGDDSSALRASQLYEQINENAEAARSKQDALSSKFEEMRQLRASSFMEVFENLQSYLTSVYTELVGEDAQARLTVIDSDKPFDGVEFTVMPPGKPFTPVSRLSGGERSMAALALLFACQKLAPAPFIVLDEVDAALDFANVSQLSKYIQDHCSETQFIAVSLKQRLFQTATNLVGVYKQKTDTSIVTVAI